MDYMLLAKALLLGIVEGMTEFLPVSSTGHLIVIGDLINFQNNGKVFEIAIQFGAILAVVCQYRQRFISLVPGITHDRLAQRFAANLLLAFYRQPSSVCSSSSRSSSTCLTPLALPQPLFLAGWSFFMPSGGRAPLGTQRRRYPPA